MSTYCVTHGGGSAIAGFFHAKSDCSGGGLDADCYRDTCCAGKSRAGAQAECVAVDYVALLSPCGRPSYDEKDVRVGNRCPSQDTSLGDVQVARRGRPTGGGENHNQRDH